MPSPRETVLASLHLRLSTLPAAVLRGEVLPERVPPDGLRILRDGDPGDPEGTLSPRRYHYDHRAEVEVIVAPRQPVERDEALDDLLAAIGTVRPGCGSTREGPSGLFRRAA